MAAFDFPASPTVGTIYTPAGGPSYIWNGTAWGLAGGPVATTLRAARNRLINGAMQISQEWGSTAVSANGSYPADQWVFFVNGTLSPQAVRTGSPGGYIYAQSFSVAKPTLAAGDAMQNTQNIEGTRVADFLWGTPNAAQVVLRFTAWADTPGLYPVSILNADSTRSFIKGVNLTASAQDYVIVIPGDTTGTWPTSNAAAMSVRFVSVCGTDYIGVEGWQAGAKIGLPGMANAASVINKNIVFTNVGLYLDQQKTGVPPYWEMPDEAEELIACQRYWEKSWQTGATAANSIGGGMATLLNGSRATTSGQFNVEKRIAPAMSFYDPSNGAANGTWFPGVASGNITGTPGVTTKGYGSYMDLAATGLAVGMSCTFNWIANARM